MIRTPRTNPGHEARILHLTETVERLCRGDYALDRPGEPPQGDLDRLEQALHGLACALAARDREQQRLDQITTRVNAGLLLDDILDAIYDDFHDLIPYNRIGLSLIEDDGQTVRARWARSDGRTIYLRRDYAAPLAGSSLQQIIETGQPRILNDLEDYLRHKPESESTRLIVAEGLRSSLTCPLIAEGVAVGFLFFSSAVPHTYRDVHVEVFQRIAAQLSVIVEKGRLVSELDQQKRAIERQNEELRRLDALKNLFLAIAAHDLRSPLGVIEMAVSVLLDPHMGLSEEERTRILRDVLHQSRHMLGLINELLDVAEIESGQLRLKPETIGLRAFLTETVERHARLAAPKGTRVGLKTPPDPAVTVQGDPLRLRQVMDNLISNAVKYSPPETLVCVEAERREGEWVIRVEDQGPGIQPEERERLFQAFGRLSARPTGGERSTGLGLAIARSVVEAHGGRIGVDSKPGSGATFWFTLPA